MTEPFIFVNTYAIKAGNLEAYQERFREILGFVEANEPRLLHIATYYSDDGTEATTVQVHPDADSMVFHMEVAGQKIAEAYPLLDWTTMSIQIYGTPNNAVLEMIRQIAGSGVAVTVKSASSGFNRLVAGRQ